MTLVYILKRLAISIPVLWLLVTLTFLFLRIVPGGPFDQDKALPPHIKANLEKEFDLDKPVVWNTKKWSEGHYIQFFTETQYFYAMKKLVHGDLGPSFIYRTRRVTDIILESLPVSIELGLYAVLFAFLLGIPLGILSAHRHNTWIDHTSMFFAISGVTLPSFLIAVILIYFFSIQWGMLPAGLWDSGFEYKVLPVVALGIRPVAIIARLMRASVLDVIQADYIRTARAKGLAEFPLMMKHVVKNSLIPVITIAAPLVAAVITGSFVIEHVFAIPGMAKHFIQAVTNRDYTLVMGVTIVYAVFLIVANITVDVMYSVVD